MTGNKRKQKNIKSYSYRRNGKLVKVRRHQRHYNCAEKKRISKKEARAIMRNRTARARNMDRKQTSSNLFNDPNSEWAADPSKSDVKGIDDKQNATRCLGITEDSTQCRNTTLNENGYCQTHQDQQNYKSYERRTRIPTQEQIVIMVEGIQYQKDSLLRAERFIRPGSEKDAIIKGHNIAIKAQMKTLKDLLPEDQYDELVKSQSEPKFSAQRFNNKYYRTAKITNHKNRPKYDDMGRYTLDPPKVGEYIETKDGMSRVDGYVESNNQLKLQEMYNWQRPPKQKTMALTEDKIYVFNKDVVEETYMKTTGKYLSKQDQNNIKYGKHY